MAANFFLDHGCTWVVQVGRVFWCIVVHKFNVGNGCAMRVEGYEVIHCISFGRKALVEVEGYTFGQATEVVMVKMAMIVYSCFGNASGQGLVRRGI